jgi:flavin-dependent thymidylate synthase
MVTDEEGFGKDCGEPAEAPIHAVPGSVAEKAATSNALVRAADAAQYARPPIPEDQRGQIRVRLLNATPDPLGSVAALCAQYEGRVIRSLSEVTDADRRTALDNMNKTVLNGPLEAVQFHFQIEGVTRSITHQMVRSRASFFAQESLRFAVPEGNWADEIPLPPSLVGVRQEEEEAYLKENWATRIPSERMRMHDLWRDAMVNAQTAYEGLIEMGMPAEEARGVLPHDMPTRIHWVCDLRTLLAEAGKRTCTQAQFPWRLIFAGIANALRGYRVRTGLEGLLPPDRFSDGWQFSEIANRLRPVCYQTGSCGFMAAFDRSCSIRSRVDANSGIGRASSEWSQEWHGPDPTSPTGAEGFIAAINDAEWALNPGAARS